MITIRNTKLFNELRKKPEWDTLFTYNEVPGYPGSQEPNIKDDEIPIFAGGLDHIDVKPKGIYFHDIGCNDRNNSFVVRPELKNEK